MITHALLLAVLLAGSTVEITAVQFPAKGKATISFGGKSKAEVERTGTVSRTSIQLEAVQPPSSFQAGMNCYVAWAVSPEGTVDNLGELEINGTKASLEATTSFDRFGILITAEPHYLVDKPSLRLAYKNESARDYPGAPVTIEVGAYDYPALPVNVTASPSIVLEARAAITIAAAVQADTKAQSEFRQARVAIDTMEELVRRVSPPDVIAAAAHAAIRRAQQATALARTKN
ncbi:MAG TPA: hypothetical protein VFD27_21925 [Chthoniobacteraceae bacterium]|nr:hypothetical protein [Chthoniobacteraceae bacterium]